MKFRMKWPVKRSRGRVPTLVAVVAAATLVCSGLVTAPAAVAAPGPGTMTVALTPVAPNGDTITTVAHGQNNDQVSFRVNYTCSVADCQDVQVAFSPTQLDPYGFGKSLLKYGSWTRPATAPTTDNTSGDDANGRQFLIGDLPAGTSGSFMVTYDIAPRGINMAPVDSQYFPSGFDVQMSAVISGENTVGTASATSAPLVWTSEIPEPAIQVNTPVNGAKPNEATPFSVTMGSGSFTRIDSTRVGGTSQFVGAGSHTTTLQLPVEAVPTLPISDGGVYDPGSNTITWSTGSEALPSDQATGGWGTAENFGWANRGIYHPRSLSLTFPAANFPGADASGCNFSESLQLSAQTSVTYLDTDRTTKTATNTVDFVVSCYEPFIGSDFTKDTSSGVLTGAVRNLAIPVSGSTDFWWVTTTNNRGNIPMTSVVSDEFTQEGLKVTRAISTYPAVFGYTLDNGVTSTATGTVLNAPTGRHITSIVVTTPDIPAARVGPDDTGSTFNRVNFLFSVDSTMVPGTMHTNTANTTVSWPGYPDFGSQDRSATRQVRLVAAAPTITATIDSAVEGGGQAVPGRNVTFSVGGSVTNSPAGFEPEYVFIAPAGWLVTDASASFDATAPGGAEFDYRTVTIAGVEREVVVASWPDGTVFSPFEPLPVMSVIAQPTYANAAGSNSLANGWVGDASRTWTSANGTYRSSVINTADVDGSGDTTAVFASASTGVPISAADSLSVIKEICQPDGDGGCNWTSDSTEPVQVPTSSGSIGYRITIQNTGNTSLSDVVAYDVLPHIGDTGLTAATSAVQRGSTFEERLDSVLFVSSNLAMSYSDSTNPSRPEVNPTAAETVDDWGAGDPNGKIAIRAAVGGALAPGASASFQYLASVAEGSDSDTIACNSVAISSNRTSPSEPRAVCASTAEADLDAASAAQQNVQLERPATVSFDFVNLGGSALAPATVSFGISDGVTVRAITFPGFTCDVATVTGPAIIECAADGELARDALVTAELEVIPTEAVASIAASITGSLSDPNPDNNETVTELVVAAAADPIWISKTDGVSGAVAGQELTYTLVVSNPLEYEELVDVTVTDTLPAGLAFVSASDGGTLSENTVSWNIASIDGGGEATVTVTATVEEDAVGPLVNLASVAAVDPSFPSATLTSTASDVTGIDSISLSKTAAVATTGAPEAGDVVTFELVATNTGAGILSDVTLLDSLPGLSALRLTWPGTPGVLAPTQQVTATADYALTQADVDAGFIANTASVTGESLGGAVASAQAETDSPLTRSAGIDLTKTASTVAPVAGETIAYSFEAENTGNVTLTGVTLIDEMADLSPLVLEWPGADGELAPGEKITATATYIVTQNDVNRGSVVNDARVSAAGANGADVEDTATVTTEFAQNPALSLEKSGALADSASVAAGDLVTFQFTATNEGNVTITDVALSDTLHGLSAIHGYTWPAAEGVLQPGETVTAQAEYELTQADIDAGVVHNSATAKGVSARGDDISADGETSVEVPGEGALVLQKAGAYMGSGPAAEGDFVEFSFIVTNSGQLTLSDVSIIDDLEGLSAIEYQWPAAAGVLAPGEQAKATASYALTQADVDTGSVANTATVVGTTSRDAQVDSVAATSVSIEGANGLALVKRAAIDSDHADGSARPGDTIIFSFEVTNTGTVTANGVVIDDPMVAIADQIESLSPGKTVTLYSAPYVVTERDAESGRVVNTATAEAVDPSGGALSSPSSTVEVDVRPASVPPVPIDGISDLPLTGGQMPWPIVGLGGVLLLLGMLLLMAKRRRREDDREWRGHVAIH